MPLVWVKQHQPRFVCSERSQHRLQASIQQRGINNSNSEEKMDKGNNHNENVLPWTSTYITDSWLYHHKSSKHHSCYPFVMQIVLSFKIMCNQRSHHTNWLLPLSCHQCAQEVDRSMPLETNICPTVNTWTSSSHEFRVRKVVTQHVHITSLLPVKSIWSWGTRRMSYTMNFSPQFASLLFFLKLSSEKTRPTTKWESE